MVGSNEDQSRSRRLGADDRGWSSTGQVLGGQMIERSVDAMCGLHYTQGDDEHGFLDLASKPRSTVSPGLAPKLVATVSPGLASKPVATVFPTMASKLVAKVLVLWPQNHSLGFAGLGLNIGTCGFVIWPTKSP
jgi:hypothetical protein